MNTATKPVAALTPWYDLAFYGLTLRLRPKTSESPMLLVCQGDTEANEERLSAFGMQPTGVPNEWGRPAANLVKDHVLAVFPAARAVQVAAASLLIRETPQWELRIETAQPTGLPVGPSSQHSEEGELMARLLAHAGVLNASESLTHWHRNARDVLCLRIEVESDDDAVDRRYIVERHSAERRVLSAATFALDSAGQLHVRSTVDATGSVGLDGALARRVLRSLLDSGVARTAVLTRADDSVWVVGMLWEARSEAGVVGRARITRAADVEMDVLSDWRIERADGTLMRRVESVRLARLSDRHADMATLLDDLSEGRFGAATWSAVGVADLPVDVVNKPVEEDSHGDGNDDERDASGDHAGGAADGGDAGSAAVSGGSADSDLRGTVDEGEGDAAASPELSGDDAADRGAAGSSEGVGAGGGAAQSTRAAAPRRRAERGDDYRLTVVPERRSFNDRRVVETNLAALRALGRIEQARSRAEVLPEDLDDAGRFVGWGGVSAVFDPTSSLHRTYYESLQALLSADEIEAAKASTLNAHYTAVNVIDAMWEGLQHLGVNEGEGLEPGAGVGLFMARLPESLQATVDFTAVEKDAVSGRLLRALYPQTRLHLDGYERAGIGDESIDFVVGNVPFGDYSVFDPRYKHLRAPIHDYFIIKSLDKLAPGGVMAVITSTGTLDKIATKFRDVMHASADLLAAVRLPNNTFAGNAGTTVTTDILVFRKRLPDETAQPYDWRGQIKLPDASNTLPQGIPVNAIFGTPRGRLLGHLAMEQGQYGASRPAVVAYHPVTHASHPSANEALGDVLRALLPANVHAPQRNARVPVAVERHYGIAEGPIEGSFLLGANQQVEVVLDGERVRYPCNQREARRVRGFITLRDLTKRAIRMQLEGCTDAALAEVQKELNTAYDAFVSADGYLSLPSNRRSFEDDPESVLVLSLEDYDPENKTAAKTAIFTERTLGKIQAVTACETAMDALVVCINEHAKVVPERIAALCRKSWEACEAELDGKIFVDPETGQYEIAARYLAGHLPRKITIAETATLNDPRYAANVEALKARLPRALTAEEIDISLGVPWVEPTVIERFCREEMNLTVEVHHNPHTAEWTINGNKHAEYPRYATRRMPALDLLETTLLGKAPRIMDNVGDSKKPVYVLNEAETALAIERQKDLQAGFVRWVWSEPTRRDRLVTKYNRIYNGYRSADYSDFEMTVPGMALGRVPRAHQAKAVTRVVMDKAVLLAHPVGFGKTATMVMAAMKLRSLGLSNKVQGVVPKNVIFQFAAEAVRWFPTARVLTVKPQDLNPKGRAAFWRKVQVSNPDLILATPEAWKRIRLSREAEMAYVSEEMSRVSEAIAFESALSGSGGKKRDRKIKEMEKIKERFKSRLEALMNGEEKDNNGITLDDLGITDLFVDEAHRFKNLQIVTRERVLGVPTAASQRASDMHAKVRHLQKSGGRTVFATGSAITNTLAEAYNLQRYLMADEMEAQGTHLFDAWKAQYGQLVFSLEPDPGGKGYRTVTRMAEIRNVPELVAMLGQITDSVADEADKVGGRPEPEFIAHSVPPTALQSLYRDVIAERVRFMRAHPREAKEMGENILVALGDSRRASLDLRTMYPGLPSADGGNKLPAVADEITRLHREYADTRSTQAVFLDFGTPPAKGAKRKVAFALNAYEDLAQQLVARGIPRKEIAFIHDAGSDEAKAELFRRVRKGDVRVIVGSTEKMGEGTNMQERMIALHHLNAPAHPGHIVQRNGRAIRQGNLHKKVFIHTWVTKGLLEDWSWHLVVLKDKFIRQVLDGLANHRDGAGLARRIVEDAAGSMDYGMIEAEASDNPLVKEKARVDAEVTRLSMRKQAHAQMRGSARSQAESLDTGIRRTRELLQNVTVALGERATYLSEQAPAKLDEARQRAKALALASAPPPSEKDKAAGVGSAEYRKAVKEIDAEHVFAVVNGVPVLGRKAAGEAMLAYADATILRNAYQSQVLLGEYEGLRVWARRKNSLGGNSVIVEFRTSGDRLVGLETDISRDAVGTIRRLDNMLDTLLAYPAELRERIESTEARIRSAQETMAMEWPDEEALAAGLAEQSRINLALAEMNSGQTEVVEGSAGMAFREALNDIFGHRVEALRESDEYDLSVERGAAVIDEDDGEDESSATVREVDAEQEGLVVHGPEAVADKAPERLMAGI